jgi:hypothetical protein
MCERDWLYDEIPVAPLPQLLSAPTKPRHLLNADSRRRQDNRMRTHRDGVGCRDTESGLPMHIGEL